MSTPVTLSPFAPQLPPVAPTGAAVSTGPGAGDPSAAGFAALVAALLAGKAAPTTPSSAPVVPGVVPEVVLADVPPDGPVADAVTEDQETGTETQPAETAPLPVLAALPQVVPVLVEVPAAHGAEPRVDTDPVATDVAVAAAASPEPAAAGVAVDQAPPTSPQPPAATPVAATAAPAPVAGQPAAPTSTNPVTRQVIPEVTRLVSQGNGTHRLTMTLRPEALGEVRVTLTVRDGEVRVRFAAGDDAQRALVEGAPELRRVLELSGAGDTRVVVRDLAQPATATSTPSSTTSTHAHSGGEGRGDTTAAGHGRSGPQDQHAGTRAGTTATDGLSDGAHALRPEPVRHTRSTGVDLTM